MLKLKLNTLVPWCKELTHWKRPWCWERLKAGGEGDYRGWDDWMASPTWWTWVWVGSGSWWWTGNPGVLLSLGSQRVRHDWATELNWTEHTSSNFHCRPHILKFRDSAENCKLVIKLIYPFFAPPHPKMPLKVGTRNDHSACVCHYVLIT